MARYGVRLETDPRLTLQDCQQLARRAEDLGYESVWLPEGRSRDAFTSLTAMALATERITLGTGIIQVFRPDGLQHRYGRGGHGGSVGRTVHTWVGRRPRSQR